MPWSSRVPVILISLALIGPRPVWANEPDDPDPLSQSRQLVSPNRIPELLTDPDLMPAATTVITAQDIERSKASTIQELLARVEGITVTDAQGFGLNADSGVTLRGFAGGSRSNMLVLLDGVRQNRVTGDEVHWQSIPLHQIERIEIIRGGGATIYGEGALAGMINIVTKQGGSKPLDVMAKAEAGSFGWQQYVTSVNGRYDHATYGTSYTRRLVNGYREFSSSRNTTVTAHGGLEAFGSKLALNVLHSEDTTQFPGGLTPAQAEARRRQAIMSRVGIFDDQTDQVAMDLTVGPYSGMSGLISAYWRDRNVDQVRSGLFTMTPSQGLSVRSAHEWSNEPVRNVLVSGFELTDDKASTGTRGDRTDESNHEGYGAYMQDTLSVWSRVSMVAGFRYDKSRFGEDIIAFDSLGNPVNYVGTLRFQGRSPTVGIACDLVPETLNVFANYSRPFKAPAVDDFASRSTEFRGNVSLHPQQSDTYELGLRSHMGRAELSTTGFYARVADEILFVQGVPGDPFIFQNRNFDTRRAGVESALRVDWPNPRLRGYLTYLFVNAEFRKGDFRGNHLPGTPEHTLNAGIGYSPLASFWIDLDWQLVHEFFRVNDVVNIMPIDNYSVLNLVLQYEMPEALQQRGWPQATAYLKVNNLTNEEYETFASSNGSNFTSGAGENPMPPFGVISGLSLNF